MRHLRLDGVCVRQYTIGMSRSLTRQQARAFRDRLRPMIKFLWGCIARMNVLGFDQQGTVYKTVQHAYDALRDLDFVLYGIMCGRPGAQPRDQAGGTGPDRK